MTEETISESDAEPEVDLGAVLNEIEQYSRDVMTEFQELGVTVDDPIWFNWCADMEAWNAAVAEAKNPS